MKQFLFLALVSLMTFTFVGCGEDDDEPLSPKQEQGDDPKGSGTPSEPESPSEPTPPVAKNPSVDFEYSIKVPADILKRGSLILSYRDEKGDEQSTELLQNDLIIQGEYASWNLSIHYDKYDVHQYLQLQFKYTESQNFVVSTQVRVKSKLGDDVIDERNDNKITNFNALVINIGGSTNDDQLSDFINVGFYVDEDGQIHDESEEERMLSNDQRQEISACTKRLLERIKADWDNIPKEAEKDDESLHRKYSEQTTDGVFKEPFVFTLDVFPYENSMWIFIEARKATSDGGILGALVIGESQEELLANLDNPEFHDEAAQRFVKYVVMIMKKRNRGAPAFYVN